MTEVRHLCGTCKMLMPDPQCINHQHTCSCGTVWLAINDGTGRIVWMHIGREE